MARIARTCPVCQLQYMADESRLKHNRQTTCSRACSYNYRAKKSSEINKGKPSPLKGKKTGRTAWNKTDGVQIYCAKCNNPMRIEQHQLGRKKFCSKSCFYARREIKNVFQVGHPDLVPAEKRGHTQETKLKIAVANRKNAKRGAEHPLWKGGSRQKRKREMVGYLYREWRYTVFSRDNWTCQVCGVRGAYLEADHILPWCAFPEQRYNVENGRTVCKPCHVKSDTYGYKALKFLEAKNG